MYNKLTLAGGLRARVRPMNLNVEPHNLPDQTGAGRLTVLRQLVTGLFRYERLEMNESKAFEMQGYAELLLQEAMRYGPKHKPTMELMDFWMLEKDLIHRVFKVYVPRFARFEAPYTKLWYVPSRPEGRQSYMSHKRILMELKGNPYPPVEPRHLDNKSSLANILLAEAKRDYVRQKIRAQAEVHQGTSVSDEEPTSTGI
ncbi:putative 39S ribosomal protein L17, mitochondrial [Hypsibius exemplaris]|uniref:Large ribosomal subunit protein bL17m n=1 Tax=Hypsibius exemplaris TaxID=2072580 RepID=A0A1W0WDM7_HYPEX|nr:putative 39S ribosomal protein L17, mitochondrial [Hypsibius exemplaris]